MIIYKNPGGNTAVPDPSNIGISDKRRFVIHQEMNMVTRQATTGAGGDWGIPITMFKGTIRLPGRMKRMGYGDKLQFSIQNATGEATGTGDWCLQCIYKEFT